MTRIWSANVNEKVIPYLPHWPDTNLLFADDFTDPSLHWDPLDYKGSTTLKPCGYIARNTKYHLHGGGSLEICGFGKSGATATSVAAVRDIANIPEDDRVLSLEMRVLLPQTTPVYYVYMRIIYLDGVRDWEAWYSINLWNLYMSRNESTEANFVNIMGAAAAAPLISTDIANEWDSYYNETTVWETPHWNYIKYIADFKNAVYGDLIVNGRTFTGGQPLIDNGALAWAPRIKVMLYTLHTQASGYYRVFFDDVKLECKGREVIV